MDYAREEVETDNLVDELVAQHTPARLVPGYGAPEMTDNEIMATIRKVAARHDDSFCECEQQGARPCGACKP